MSVFRKRVNKKVHVGSLDAGNSLFFILGSSYILLCYLFILNAPECVLHYINLKKLKINKISTDGSDRHPSPEASRQVLLCQLGPSRTIRYLFHLLLHQWKMVIQLFTLHSSLIDSN